MFHSNLLILLIFISVFVGTMMFFLVKNSITHSRSYGSYWTYKALPEPGFWLEYLWTSMPALILLMFLGTGLDLLYKVESNLTPELTVKVMGFQWFWGYEYSDCWYWKFMKTPYYNWESHLKKANLVPEDLRLLVVDKSLLVPVNTPIRVLITSADVIHSWSLPKASVKVDAVPGRVNQTMINFQDTGRFYGMCSEICGAGHSQMPIVVDSVTQKEWLSLM